MVIFSFVCVIIIFLSLCSMFYYSWMSRNRHTEGRPHALARSLMNISMGILFIAIASIQFALPTKLWFRYIFIALIYLVGLYNLYYGIQRYRLCKADTNDQ